jgi:hypothetical protein
MRQGHLLIQTIVSGGIHSSRAGVYFKPAKTAKATATARLEGIRVEDGSKVRLCLLAGSGSLTAGGNYFTCRTPRERAMKMSVTFPAVKGRTILVGANLYVRERHQWYGTGSGSEMIGPLEVDLLSITIS